MSWIARRDPGSYGVRNRKDRPQPPTGEERQRESGQENRKAGLTTGAGRGCSEQPRDGTEEARQGSKLCFMKTH